MLVLATPVLGPIYPSLRRVPRSSMPNGCIVLELKQNQERAKDNIFLANSRELPDFTCGRLDSGSICFDNSPLNKYDSI
jgi:hypothetical protein